MTSTLANARLRNIDPTKSKLLAALPKNINGHQLYSLKCNEENITVVMVNFHYPLFINIQMNRMFVLVERHGVYVRAKELKIPDVENVQFPLENIDKFSGVIAPHYNRQFSYFMYVAAVNNFIAHIHDDIPVQNTKDIIQQAPEPEEQKPITQWIVGVITDGNINLVDDVIFDNEDECKTYMSRLVQQYGQTYVKLELQEVAKPIITVEWV